MGVVFARCAVHAGRVDRSEGPVAGNTRGQVRIGIERTVKINQIVPTRYIAWAKAWGPSNKRRRHCGEPPCSSSVSVPVADDYTAVWALGVVIGAPRVAIEDSRQVSPLSL